MVNYELVYITRPDLNEANNNAIKDKVKSVLEGANAQLVSYDEWGKRKLAYPISKETRGIYYIVKYNATTGIVVDEIERNLRLNENILRFLTVKLPVVKAKPAKKPKKKAEKAPAPAQQQ